jgi:hypothetical protein
MPALGLAGTFGLVLVLVASAVAAVTVKTAHRR